jgi:adenosine deaminase
MDEILPPAALERLTRAHLPALLARMPKAELHIHIEGSLEPELIFALARRNDVALPYASEQALRAAYAFTDLQSFLDIYYAGASVLLREADFFDMAMAYFRRAAADGVIHAELFFDPQTHTARGVPMRAVIEGLARAQAEAEATLGLSSALILCFLRHLHEADAIATLEAALPWRERFVGVGLDSSERGHPPEKFARVFARCRALGLRPVAHAGEEGPPAYIRTALDELRVQRIDHGVRCAEDPELMRMLAQSRVPLTVCPLSNIKLRVFARMEDHVLPELLRAGLCVTVNSDDPAYFGGYLLDNYRALFAAHPALGPREAWRLAANGFEASFAEPATKTRWIQALAESVDAIASR